MSQQQLDFLVGQINALSACCSAFIKTHPDLDALENRLIRSFAYLETASLSAAVQESYFVGMEEMQKRILGFVANAREMKSKQEPPT